MRTVPEARTKRLGLAALILVSAVWFGLILGVSGIATPVKFAAPTLDRAAAMDVGQVTFALFSRIEWASAGLLLLALAAARFPVWAAATFGVVLACLVAQGAWLLPGLSARAATIIAGDPLTSSHHHLAYVVLEGVKLLALAGICLTVVRKRFTGPS